MKIGQKLTQFSVDHYRGLTVAVAAITLTIALLAAGGSLPIGRSMGLNPITVDTDPENMLSEDEPVRVFHDRMKETMGLHDMVVVGVVNQTHPEGVFNVESLRRIHELTKFASTLTGEAIGRKPGEGVIEGDILAPSEVNRIEPIPPAEGQQIGGVSLSLLMPQPPETQAEALAIRDQALRVPFYKNTLVSEDGKAIAIYLPISQKDVSYATYRALQEKIDSFAGDDKWYITGLPVAEDTFGVEMFIQMAISAPSAMAVIFLLMLVFFRKLIVIISPMLVALVSVIFTMGLLIIAGFPIHIMSSMIPIFIMPIAVLDSIHIISEFFEKYQQRRDRRQTILNVMDELFAPMLYTSLTSAAGFASLALTPIPPVQVFGVFVAIGILAAWLLTVTFIPAFVMFISPQRLENFGATQGDSHAETAKATFIGRILHAAGRRTYRYAKPILAVAAIVLVAAGWGISQINVNDNPIKWFHEDHPIRVADRVLNGHFGGTYMAYLSLQAAQPDYAPDSFAQKLQQNAQQRREDINAQLDRYGQIARDTQAALAGAYFDQLARKIRPSITAADDDTLSAANAAVDLNNRLAGDYIGTEDFDRAAFLEDLDEKIVEQKEATDTAFAALEGLVEQVAQTQPARQEAFLAALEQKMQEAVEPIHELEPSNDPGQDIPEMPGEDLPPAPAGPESDMPAPAGPDDSMPGLPGLDDDLPSPVRGGGNEAAGQEQQLSAEMKLAWDQVTGMWLGDIQDESKVFQDPAVLAWMKRFEAQAAIDTGVVGKSTSVVTIAETIRRDMLSGKQEDLKLPATQKAVAQTLLQFQSGHVDTRDDLWHFVTPDYRRATVWMQLTSGDNEDMSKVVAAAERWVDQNPPPASVQSDLGWFGLTYINVVWQEKMTWGMMEAFAGSFLVVFLLMTVLFRSPLWGLLSMIPLTVTIAAIYGAIGILGKDYDMPVAVLSSLTLGLAVDFAIHFLARARTIYAETGSWQTASSQVFAEPARAIVRNIIVIAVGFTPLLLAPLVPYQTVGILLATILLVSGVGTLLLLPALIRLLEKPLFAHLSGGKLSCNCGLCLVSSITLTAVVALALYRSIAFTTLTWIGGAGIIATVTLCGLISRRQRCRIESTQKEQAA